MTKINIHKPLKDQKKNQLRNIYSSLVNLQTQLNGYENIELKEELYLKKLDAHVILTLGFVTAELVGKKYMKKKRG